MKKNYVLDTNILLHDPYAIFKFDDNNVIIPIYVIEEVDQFKREGSERGRNARQVVRLLDELRDAGGSLSKGIPMKSGGILVDVMRGACAASSVRGSEMASRILPRMWSRASRACDRADRRISVVTPVILMSIWSAVTPCSVPATLKSMSPRWSSAPWMSVRMT